MFQFTVTVTKSFVDYIKTKPLLFEVFGHYLQHSLCEQASGSAPLVHAYSFVHVCCDLCARAIHPHVNHRILLIMICIATRVVIEVCLFAKTMQGQ